MENLTLQQLVTETQAALDQAGASNYYKSIFKTLTKQLLLYARDKGVDSFSMDFGLQFLEEHYTAGRKLTLPASLSATWPHFCHFQKLIIPQGQRA